MNMTIKRISGFGSPSRYIQGPGVLAELSKYTEIPIEFRDERLTTVSAQKLMKTTRKGSKARDDAMAAALILQEYLDEKIA